MAGMYPERTYEGGYPSATERVNSFIRGVYGWMAVGLVLTATTAGVVASSPLLIQAIFTNRLLFWGLVIAQFGIVIALSARADKLAPATAAMLFVAYSMLTGVTLSSVLLVFTGASVASTFVVTAGMFGALALYGSTTQRDLTGIGSLALMGLFGMIIASLVGFFWHSDALQFVISFIGVIVFTGLTAYDAQRLKAMALAMPGAGTGSYQIVGALTLYLNFINLFLLLLRFMGNRRD